MPAAEHIVPEALSGQNPAAMNHSSPNPQNASDDRVGNDRHQVLP
jgi:hypothetical protein